MATKSRRSRRLRLRASSPSAPFAAIENPTRNLFGVQFHPEVTHTDKGEALVGRLARDLCGCQGDWTPANIVDDAIASIRDRGQDKVVLGLSGGVDSSVLARRSAGQEPSASN